MCLILLAWQAHAHYPLVLAANRDEYFARGAAPAAWWTDSPDVLGGRDLSAGGTWLALARSGRFAALTNYRDPTSQRAGAPSRGALVPALIGSDKPLEAQLEWLHAMAPEYNGFNVLFGDRERLAVFESVPRRGRLLEAGIYGLSNHLLDTPWPKLVNAKSALAAGLDTLPDEQRLLTLLRDDRPADDAKLPRTGVSAEWERLLSSAFIRAPGYGTRCSTMVLRDRSYATAFTEWTWNAAGEAAGRVDMQFFADAA